VERQQDVDVVVVGVVVVVVDDDIFLSFRNIELESRQENTKPSW